MVKKMETDHQNIKVILDQVVQEAERFFANIDSHPSAVSPTPIMPAGLPTEGYGAMGALEQFQASYAKQVSGSAGPRYLGFVTGGATPASVAGDWLVSVYDQNLSGIEDSAAGQVELEAIAMLRELFHLPEEFSGAFVSGATMANFVGLAQARQWVAHQLGINIAQQGLYHLPPIKIVSGAPHSSVYKSLSMLGMGRESMQLIPCLDNREAIDIALLRAFLEENKATPCVVVANAGTVNSVDYDDLQAIGQLKQEYSFWFHVDAAFGGFAACSPTYNHLTSGIDQADSITIDAHKWLNVPYDSAMQFTRHKSLQVEVFQNHAAYLGNAIDHPEFAHLTPENSRRFRALPAWFTLKAYGHQGYQQIVEENVAMARLLAQKIEQEDKFELVAPTRLNVVCFTLKQQDQVITFDDIKLYLDRLKQEGHVFMTPTIYKGKPAIRAAFSNWRTTRDDVDIIWHSLCKVRRDMDC
ncbi:amino acid decarboxylase [Brevibacillus reuszeri]|uniref:Amino acid decarboxylase n=1 Tax=Brevibacillus reuszeri TaxID=54915 RepID=A0A0K9YS08_9BACL|nr:pyridoxal-dependent decarboxylase [Brevibacillus reuszeri]KNB71514.1 amino acid decarboxylase [Brevibacillus reuszeri]MED1855680.1 pyridoxal-dependent decarboxylase [Brevibacillus reuszeri]GED67170.1 amino acid decarboxylase [Brevibacillus reuszeri]